MSCRPDIFSLFKKKRTYIIRIGKNCEIKFDKIPEKTIKLGVIAHEFCHIIDYDNKSLFALLITGINYLAKEGKKSLEQKVDTLTVKKGYGKELIARARFSMNRSSVSEKYRKFKKDIYLGEEDINKIMGNKIPHTLLHFSD